MISCANMEQYNYIIYKSEEGIRDDLLTYRYQIHSLSSLVLQSDTLIISIYQHLPMTQNILDRILHFILLIPMIKFHNISEILISPSLISIDDVVTTIELDPHHVIYTIKCEKTKIIRFSIQLTDTLIIRLPCFFIDFMFFHSKTHCSWNELDLYRDFDLSTFPVIISLVSTIYFV